MRRRPRGRGVGSSPKVPGAESLRVASFSPEGPPEKRARHEEGDSSRGKKKEMIAIPKEEEERGGKIGEGETDVETRAWANEVPWAPVFCHYARCLIHHTDSASSNIGTTFRVLRSCILPRDARAVKGCTEDLTGEIAQTLLNVSPYSSLLPVRLNDVFYNTSCISCCQAGARALAINDRYKRQEQEIEELKHALATREDDLRVAWETCDLYLANFQKCDRERALVENRATKAEEDATTLRVTRASEVDVVRDKGYDEGWDAVRVEYKKQVWEIEAELHREHFLDGLRYGHETLLSKLDLPDDSELRAIPQLPSEELVLLEEENEIVLNPEVEIAPDDQADPNTTAPADAKDDFTLVSFLEKHLNF